LVTVNDSNFHGNSKININQKKQAWCYRNDHLLYDSGTPPCSLFESQCYLKM